FVDSGETPLDQFAQSANARNLRAIVRDYRDELAGRLGEGEHTRGTGRFESDEAAGAAASGGVAQKGGGSLAPADTHASAATEAEPARARRGVASCATLCADGAC